MITYNNITVLEKLFTQRVVGQWNVLHKEVIAAPSLTVQEMFGPCFEANGVTLKAVKCLNYKHSAFYYK